MDENSDTFVRISNKNIYDKLVEIEARVIKTNGKVKTHEKIIYSMGATIIIIIGWLLNNL